MMSLRKEFCSPERNVCSGNAATILVILQVCVFSSESNY